MTAHTPGPWTAIDNLVVVTEDTHGYSTWLANLSVGGNSRIEQYSNARLMAAAPCLLAALKVLVESVSGVDQVSAVNEARAAIAKAIGDKA